MRGVQTWKERVNLVPTLFKDNFYLSEPNVTGNVLLGVPSTHRENASTLHLQQDRIHPQKDRIHLQKDRIHPPQERDPECRKASERAAGREV